MSELNQNFEENCPSYKQLQQQLKWVERDCIKTQFLVKKITEENEAKTKQNECLSENMKSQKRFSTIIIIILIIMCVVLLVSAPLLGLFKTKCSSFCSLIS